MGASGTAVIDFGAWPGSNEASVNVTGQTAILSTSETDAWFVAQATGDHTISDHTYVAPICGLTTGIPTDGVGFTIYARSFERLTGTFNVQWAWN